MTEENALNASYQFLSGGGEMGKLIRAKDWSTTPLGAPESWPQSLRTMVSVMLDNPFGMYIAWGTEYTQIYNDGYRPILGAAKHPKALGINTRETFAEIWHIIGSMFEDVMNGIPVGFPDFMLPLDRNGFIENCYFDFAYSPIRKEDGKVGGVLVTVIETTNKKKAIDDLKESEERFRTMAEGTDIYIAVGDENGNAAYFNKAWAKLTGRAVEDMVNSGWTDLMHPDDKDLYLNNYLNTFNKREHFTAEFRILNAEGEYRWLWVQAPPRFRPDGSFAGYISSCMDITGRKNTEQHLIKVFKKSEENEKKFRDIVQQAPLAIAIFRGAEFVAEVANENYLFLVDKKESEFIGKPLFETLPEVRIPVENIFNDLMRTGIPFYGDEFHVNLKRMGKIEPAYFSLVYHPLKEDNGDVSGIMVVATEVTTIVKAKHLLEESEKHFRNMVMQSPIPMTILKGENYIIESANKVLLEKVWRKPKEDVLGISILDAFPELRAQKYPELLHTVFTSGKTYSEKESVAFVQGRDGMKKFYLDFEYAPLFQPDGKVLGIMITVNDVTDKVEARMKVEEAEERLRLAIEATDISTWDLDLQNRHIIHSPRLAVLFGHSSSTILSHAQMRNQIHPDDLKNIIEKAFDQAMITGSYQYEARVVTKDYGTRWIRTQGRVFYDENKKPAKMLGTLRDITEERLYQQVLQESESKFRLLADSLPQQIWTADPAGNIYYYNQTVFDFTRLSQEQLDKDGWIQMVHPDDRKENIKLWMDSVSTGKDFLFEHRFRRYDGEYRWQLSRAIPQRDAAGNIQMWVGSSTDIQDIKEQEQQKDYFISMASHELKTPLTSIKGYVQLLQSINEKSEDTFLKSSLKTIDKQIETLTKLISELLDVSKIKSSGLDFNKESFEITELIHEIIAEIKHINPEYDISIKAKEKIMVYADRNRIGQVLINLLTNAVKYGPQSKIIGVTCRRINNQAVISIKDQGIGISKQNQEKIFERFYRVEGRNEKTFPGFGIGLFIVAEIIKRHDGKIHVESEPGKGSVFTFELPVKI